MLEETEESKRAKRESSAKTKNEEASYVNKGVGYTKAANSKVFTIRNKNTPNWWNDISIELDGTKFTIIGSSLNIKDNYEIIQLINSYHTFVMYHNMLVRTIENKPLSLAYLNVIDVNGILSTIETITNDVGSLKESISNLEETITGKIVKYIEKDEVSLSESSKWLSIMRYVKSIFSLRRENASSKAIENGIRKNMISC